MRAGNLDRLITIQRFTSSQATDGSPIEAWSTIVARRAASYRPLRGEERFTTPQLVAREQAEFRIRWSNDVANLTPKDRIIYPALAEASPEDAPDTRLIWDIIEVPEIGRREGLRITAARRADVTP